MVKLMTKIGPKGQIVLPKRLLDLLGLKPGNFVFLDLDETKTKILVEKEDFDDSINWLKSNQKPLVKSPITYSIEDEYEENISG